MTQDPARPMLDRSIAGIYPPASTFKALVALAGLEEGVIAPSHSVIPFTIQSCHGSAEWCHPVHLHQQRLNRRPTLLSQRLRLFLFHKAHLTLF